MLKPILPIAILMATLMSAGNALGAQSPTAAKATAWMQGNLSHFRTRAMEWRAALATDPAAFTDARLKAGLDTLRRAYKTVEPAVERLQPQCIALFNGAPLNRPDKETAIASDVKPPQGLLGLEKEIYRDGPGPDRARVDRLLAQLAGAADQLAELLRASSPDDATWWEAAENEVVRVLALGLSGFDTPASGRGLIESGTALHSLSDFAFLYRSALDGKSRGSFAALDARLRYAGRALEMAGDFNEFDRLDFMRRHGNPLQAEMVAARQSLGLGRSGPLLGATRADRHDSLKAQSPGNPPQAPERPDLAVRQAGGEY